MTQNPEILTWLIVMPLSACATWSWHQLASTFDILQSFSNSTGCWIHCWIRDFPILRPTLSTPYASTYGSSLNNLLFDSNFFGLLSKTISFPKYLLCTDLMIFKSAVCISPIPINFSCKFYVVLVKAPSFSWLIWAIFSYKTKPMQWSSLTSNSIF